MSKIDIEVYLSSVSLSYRYDILEYFKLSTGKRKRFFTSQEDEKNFIHRVRGHERLIKYRLMDNVPYEFVSEYTQGVCDLFSVLNLINIPDWCYTKDMLITPSGKKYIFLYNILYNNYRKEKVYNIVTKFWNTPELKAVLADLHISHEYINKEEKLINRIFKHGYRTFKLNYPDKCEILTSMAGDEYISKDRLLATYSCSSMWELIKSSDIKHPMRYTEC